MKKQFKFLKKIELSWYIKLNILVMSFLFVVFLIKQSNTNQFQQGLQAVFSSNNSLEQNRPSVEIRRNP